MTGWTKSDHDPICSIDPVSPFFLLLVNLVRLGVMCVTSTAAAGRAAYWLPGRDEASRAATGKWCQPG